MIVTCVIPVRNGASTVKRAINSALEAGCDYVSVFDDDSTDETSNIVSQMRNDNFNISLCGFEFHAGVNFARNFLINSARDGLIIPLDADDCLNDITPLRDAWEPDTWVYGDHIERCGDSIEYRKGAAAGALVRKNITGISFMFHRRDWLKVGGYDYDFAYAEDYAFQCALTNAGIKPKYVEHAVYDRYVKAEGNKRSAMAGVYWSFYRDMARAKYKNLFANVG